MKGKKIIRQYIKKSIDRLFEATAEEIKADKENIAKDIERDEKHIDIARKEAEVAKANKVNTQKTKSNVRDIDPTVEKEKKILAAKELEKYKEQEKEKRNLAKDLEDEKAEDMKKKAEIDKMQPSETNLETSTEDAQPNTPETPTSAGVTD